MNILLWIIQILLALLFLFAGGTKLVLPGLFRVRQGLTALAATGLAIIMVGAVIVTIAGDGIVLAITPFIVGLLCAFVAYARGVKRW